MRTHLNRWAMGAGWSSERRERANLRDRGNLTDAISAIMVDTPSRFCSDGVTGSYRSVTPQEQKHIAMALTFELSKVDIVEIRRRTLGHVDVIDPKLGATVAEELGMLGEALKANPPGMPIDLDPSPALRLYGKYQPTLKGRKVGVLLAADFNLKLKNALMIAIKKEGATPAIIAPMVGCVKDSEGTKHHAEMALSGSPSV